MIELRLKSKISPAEMAEKVGKILTEDDYNLIAVRDVTVRKPDGSILLVYRKGAISEEIREQAWPVLQGLKKYVTSNRGMAGGTPRVSGASGKRTYGKPVASMIAGSFDPAGPKTYCRLTAWTAQEPDAWRELWPLLNVVGDKMREDVPDRYTAQMRECERTHPDWLIPGTPFTTVTVNNTYETGVHTDKGDLDEGISTIVCFREGAFNGGVLVFPEYRVAVDLQDRDLILMDAHEWHGNTAFDPPIPRKASGAPATASEAHRSSGGAAKTIRTTCRARSLCRTATRSRSPARDETLDRRSTDTTSGRACNTSRVIRDARLPFLPPLA